MKKILIVLLIIMMTGCQDKESDQEAQESNTNGISFIDKNDGVKVYGFSSASHHIDDDMEFTMFDYHNADTKEYVLHMYIQQGQDNTLYETTMEFDKTSDNHRISIGINMTIDKENSFFVELASENDRMEYHYNMSEIVKDTSFTMSDYIITYEPINYEALEESEITIITYRFTKEDIEEYQIIMKLEKGEQ